MNDLEQQIIDLYNSGIGADTIGKQLNINRNKVYTVLKKFNIPRRNNKTKGRRYTHNHIHLVFHLILFVIHSAL